MSDNTTQLQVELIFKTTGLIESIRQAKTELARIQQGAAGAAPGSPRYEQAVGASQQVKGGVAADVSAMLAGAKERIPELRQAVARSGLKEAYVREWAEGGVQAQRVIEKSITTGIITPRAAGALSGQLTRIMKEVQSVFQAAPVKAGGPAVAEDFRRLYMQPFAGMTDVEARRAAVRQYERQLPVPPPPTYEATLRGAPAPPTAYQERAADAAMRRAAAERVTKQLKEAQELYGQRVYGPLAPEKEWKRPTGRAQKISGEQVSEEQTLRNLALAELRVQGSIGSDIRKKLAKIGVYLDETGKAVADEAAATKESAAEVRRNTLRRKKATTPKTLGEPESEYERVKREYESYYQPGGPPKKVSAAMARMEEARTDWQFGADEATRLAGRRRMLGKEAFAKSFEEMSPEAQLIERQQREANRRASEEGKRRGQTTKTIEKAVQEEAKATDPEGLAARTRLTNAKLATAVAEQSSRNAILKEENATFLETQAKTTLASSSETLTAEQRREQGLISQHAELTAQLTAEQAEERAMIAKRLASDESYIADQAITQTENKRLAAAVAEQVAAMGMAAESEASLAMTRAEEKAATQRILADSEIYHRNVVSAAVDHEREQASINEMLAGNDQYIKATAENARSKELQSAKITMTRAGESYEGLTKEETIARAAVVKRIRSEQERAAVNEAMSKEDIAAMVRSKVAVKQRNAAINAEERAITREMAARGELGGTGFQRWMTRTARGAPVPTDNPTAGQFVGQALTRSLGFATAAAPMMAVFGVIEAMKEAAKLEVVFTRLHGQLETLGKGDYFGNVKSGIKEIATLTGQSIEETATFFSRVVGIFGDPTRALQETEAAMKLARLAGTSLAAEMQNLIPITKAFNVGFNEIGDTAVWIHDRFGIAEQASLEFMGAISASAKEAGLSMNEAWTLGAAAATALGKPLSTIGDQLSKVFQTISSNAGKFVQMFEAMPNTQELAAPFVQMIGAGDTGKAFEYLLQNYDKLNAAQQQQVIRLSGSRREWADLAGLYGHADDVLRSLTESEQVAESHGGLLNRRFGEVAETMSVSMDRIKESVSSLIESLAALGVLDIGATLLSGLQLVFDLIDKILGAFRALDEVTGGVAGKITKPFVELGLLALVTEKYLLRHAAAKEKSAAESVKLAAAEETQAGAQGGAAAAATAETEAEGSAAVAKDGAAVSNEALTATEMEKVAAEEAGTVSAGEEAAAETVNARTKMSGALTRMFPTVSGWLGRGGGAAAGAAGAEGAAGAGAAGAGAAAGAAASPLWIIPMAVFAAAKVKETRDEIARGLEAQSNDLRGKLKTTSDQNLKALGEDYNDFWDRLQEGIFGVDLPGTLARKEVVRRRHAEGQKFAHALIGANQADEWIRRLNQGSMDQITEILNSSAETRKFAEDAGALEQTWYQTVWDKVTAGPGRQMLHMGPSGEVRVTKENLKGIIDLAQKRADEGDEAAGRVVDRLKMVQDTNGGMADIQGTIDRYLDDQIKSGNFAAAAETAGGYGPLIERELDPTELQNKVKQGEMSIGSYISELKGKASRARQILDAAKASGNVDLEKQEQAAFDQAQTLILDEEAKQREARLQFLSKAAAAAAPERAKEIEFQNRMARLSQVPRAQQWAEAGQDIEMGYLAWQEQTANMNLTPTERMQKQRSGWQIPKNLRINQLAERIQGDQGVMDFIRALLPDMANVAGEDGVVQEIAEKSVQNNWTVAQAFMDTWKHHYNKPITPEKTREAQAVFGSVPQADEIYGGFSTEALTPEEQAAAESPNWRRAPILRIRQTIDKITHNDAAMDAISALMAFCEGISVEDAIKEIATMAVNDNMTIGNALNQVFKKYYHPKVTPTAQQAEAITKAKEAAWGTLGEMPAVGEVEGSARPFIEKEEKELQIRTATAQLELARKPKDQRAQLQGRYNQISDDLATKRREAAEAQGKEREAIEEQIRQLEIQQEQAWQSILDYNDGVARAMDEFAEARLSKSTIGRAQQHYQTVLNDIERAKARGAQPDDLVPLEREAYQANESILDAVDAAAAANDEWASVWAREDPIAQAEAALYKANRDIERAVARGTDPRDMQPLYQAQQRAIFQRQQADADIYMSQLALQQAQVEEDPVAAARVALQMAEQQVVNARELKKGKVAENEANGALMRARRALRDAISASADVESNMIIALANARGDTVGAAQEALKRVRQRLAEAQAQGTNPDLIKQLTGEVANTARSALDAEVQDHVSVIDFMLEMGQMTVANAITALQVEAAKYESNTEAWRNLQLKIHTLQQQTKADLQFNLPSNISLPTLYEARRMNQSYMMGIGYNDARQINVTVNVNGAQDPMAVSTQVVNALNSSVNTGATYSPGMLVGGR